MALYLTYPEPLALLIISSSPALPARPAPLSYSYSQGTSVFSPAPPSYSQETGVWVADESVAGPVAVAVSDLVRVVPAEYGQRQIRGPSNPHGEHAHDIWQVSV